MFCFEHCQQLWHLISVDGRKFPSKNLPSTQLFLHCGFQKRNAYYVISSVILAVHSNSITFDVDVRKRRILKKKGSTTKKIIGALKDYSISPN